MLHTPLEGVGLPLSYYNHAGMPSVALTIHTGTRSSSILSTELHTRGSCAGQISRRRVEGRQEDDYAPYIMNQSGEVGGLPAQWE
jgi:hypothetical protein